MSVERKFGMLEPPLWKRLIKGRSPVTYSLCIYPAQSDLFWGNGCVYAHSSFKWCELGEIPSLFPFLLHLSCLCTSVCWPLCSLYIWEDCVWLKASNPQIIETKKRGAGFLPSTETIDTLVLLPMEMVCFLIAWPCSSTLPSVLWAEC